MKISPDEAMLFLLVGIPKLVAQTGTQVIKGTVELARLAPHLRAIQQAMSMGANFSQAVRLSTTVVQGARTTFIGAEGVAVTGSYTFEIKLTSNMKWRRKLYFIVSNFIRKKPHNNDMFHVIALGYLEFGLVYR